MSRLPLRIFCSAVITLCAIAGLDAQQDKQLVIQSATANRVSETLTIRGKNFANTVLVQLEESTLPVLSANPFEIVVQLPASVADGSYLLLVMKGNGNSNKSTDRDVFHVTLTTPVPGPSGPAGPAGVTGAAGARGVDGATGPAGPAGPAGPIGPEGPMGPMGPAGPVGPSGATGATGAAGAVGPMGPEGRVGPVGPAGPAGAAGATGAMGPAGPAGPAGAAGAAGPMGPMGPMGPAGVSGLQVVSAYAFPVPTNVAAFASATATATCPAGKVAIGGGFEGSGDAWFMYLYASYPSAPNAWTVSLKNRDTSAKNSVQVRVYAVCAAAQ